MQEVCVYVIDIGPGPGLGAAAAAAWFISEQTSERASAVLLLRVVVTFWISALLDKCFGAGRMSFITRQSKILSKGWAHVKLWKILFGSLVANSFACSYFICSVWGLCISRILLLFIIGDCECRAGFVGNTSKMYWTTVGESWQRPLCEQNTMCPNKVLQEQDQIIFSKQTEVAPLRSASLHFSQLSSSSPFLETILE